VKVANAMDKIQRQLEQQEDIVIVRHTNILDCPCGSCETMKVEVEYTAFKFTDEKIGYSDYRVERYFHQSIIVNKC